MDNYGYVPEENNGRPYTIARANSGAKQINPNEFLVSINSRFKPSKKPIYYQRATIILTILVVILLIGLIVILALFIKTKQTKLCTSNQCIRSAANLRYSLDSSVDPCDDFYRFCCGKWSKEHPNHGWYSSFSTFTTVTEKIVIEALDVLSDDVKEGEPMAVSHAKRLYESCMSTEAADALGLTSLYSYLEMTNLPIVPNFFNKSLEGKNYKFDWTKTEVLLKLVLAMDIFIGFTVQPNFYKRNESVIYLGLLFQSCPLPSPFKKKLNGLRRPWGKDIGGNGRFKTMANSKEEDDDQEEDDKDSSENERDELRTKIRTNIIKHVVKEIMKNNSETVTENSQLQMAADIINNITYYVDDLNENYTLPVEIHGEDVTKKYTFKEIQELMDNNINIPMPNFWIKYISSIFADTNVTIDPQTDLLYITDLELEYLWRILDYVSSQPPIYIELYMWWAAVYAMILNTSSDITEYVLSQTSLYYASTSTDNSVYVRSSQTHNSFRVNEERISELKNAGECMIVGTQNFLALDWASRFTPLQSLSYIYLFFEGVISFSELPKDSITFYHSGFVADKLVVTGGHESVDKMIQDIKDAFVEHVQGIQWMDDSTKKVTLEKSREMISFIGYPDWLLKEGALDRKYPGLEINETTYLDNMVAIIKQSITETLTSLRLTNPRDWSTEAITVNAFNSFSDNAINVPMAILNYPLYDLGLEVLNYGSIGSILGHELTHGFDNTGRKHDKYGNYIQWWSNKTIDTFENMTKCFIDQYDNYTIEGVKGHVKGIATLGENLADNGGLNQAYTAYKRYRKKYGEEPKLPGFEQYSSDQLFFLAYGSIWCETSTIDDLKSQLEYDEHCPNSLRVIGTLQNSEEFAKAYSCPQNSYMNPKRKKCKIW